MKITLKETKEVKTSTPKEYAPGVYEVRIINAEEGVSTNGTEFLGIEVETVGEDVFKVRNRFYKTEKALSILLNFLSAIGLYDADSDSDIEFTPNDLLGVAFIVELVKGEPNEQGKSYLEFKPWSCNTAAVPF